MSDMTEEEMEQDVIAISEALEAFAERYAEASTIGGGLVDVGIIRAAQMIMEHNFLENETRQKLSLQRAERRLLQVLNERVVPAPDDGRA